MTTETKTNGKDIIGAMFEAGAHFGYQKSRRHASTAPYIFGVKNKVEIIDLAATAKQLETAKAFISSIAASGKQVLFVGGKQEARNLVQTNAESIGMPYVASRWIGGTLTNAPEIKKRIAKFEDLGRQKEKGELSKYTKKERLLIDREIAKLESMFAGIVAMKDMPKALIVVDPRKEFIAVAEAQKTGVPVVAILNTDCDMAGIDYPIVANDASIPSIALILGELAQAYQAGKSAAA